MLDNDDRIARPARGRFFPVTPADIIKLIRDLGFDAPPCRNRLNIVFENPRKPGAHGSAVAALHSDHLIICSLPEDFDHQRAEEILELALGQLAEVSKHIGPAYSQTTEISIRAYLASPAKLILTKRTRRATRQKYRGDAKFSHAFKASGISTDEEIVRSIDLT